MQQEKTPRERAEDLISLLVADWRPTPRQVLWAIRISIVVTFALIALLLILYLIGLLFGITVWNLLKVLAVPITIGAAVPLLNWLQKKRELDVENQRAQDSALEGYEEKMERLILDRGLRTSERGDDSREVARLHTLSVLRRLDPNRKRHVVKFLWEGNLIRYERQETAGGRIQEEPPIISLDGSDLTGANLSRMDLRFTNLWGAQLVGADLSGAGLSAMQGTGEDWVRARVSGISFESTMRPVDAARLVRANLRDADLRGAQLMGVDLTWADLRGADLTGARVTVEQLERADHLEGATMPDGRKYEDWLNDGEDRGEDGENNGPS